MNARPGSILPILGAIVLLVGAILPAAASAEEVEDRSEPAATEAAMARVLVVAGSPRSSAAKGASLRVLLDPETGKPRALRGEEAEGAEPERKRAPAPRRKRVPGDTDLISLERADGSALVRLDERFWSTLHATLSPSGEAKVQHGLPAPAEVEGTSDQVAEGTVIEVSSAGDPAQIVVEEEEERR